MILLPGVVVSEQGLAFDLDDVVTAWPRWHHDEGTPVVLVMVTLRPSVNVMLHPPSWVTDRLDPEVMLEWATTACAWLVAAAGSSRRAATERGTLTP